MVADGDHFQQILVNYVANALGHGAVPFRVEASAENDAVLIRVVDHGDGVPEAFVSQLFKRFSQATTDNSRSASGGMGRGAGLGLSIVRALAIAQNGEVWFEPNMPTGSCFNLRLPRAGASAMDRA